MMREDQAAKKWSEELYGATQPKAPLTGRDLSWAERIVENNIRGINVSRSSLPLKMAREALENEHRLKAVETEVRDRIAAERGAATVSYRESA